MASGSILRRQKSKAAYYGWVGVFVLMLLGIVGLIYFATMKIDYVWQWYKLPNSYDYKNQIETLADINPTLAENEKKCASNTKLLRRKQEHTKKKKHTE